MPPPLSEVRRLLAAWEARAALRRCDLVGPGWELEGRPFVLNDGTIEIGARFVICSLPVVALLVTGPNGVLRIGDRVRIGHGVSVNAHAEVSVGDGTVIEPFVMIFDHDFHEVQDRTAPGTARPIHIGRRVRIGAGAVILRGTHIGDDAVIAPNSVVSRRIPPRTRAAGVPARPVDERS